MVALICRSEVGTLEKEVQITEKRLQKIVLQRNNIRYCLYMIVFLREILKILHPQESWETSDYEQDFHFITKPSAKQRINHNGVVTFPEGIQGHMQKFWQTFATCKTTKSDLKS